MRGESSTSFVFGKPTIAHAAPAPHSGIIIAPPANGKATGDVQRLDGTGHKRARGPVKPNTVYKTEAGGGKGGERIEKEPGVACNRSGKVGGRARAGTHRPSRRGRSAPPPPPPAAPRAAWGGSAQLPGPQGPPALPRVPRFPLLLVVLRAYEFGLSNEDAAWQECGHSAGAPGLSGADGRWKGLRAAASASLGRLRCGFRVRAAGRDAAYDCADRCSQGWRGGAWARGFGGGKGVPSGCSDGPRCRSDGAR